VAALVQQNVACLDVSMDVLVLVEIPVFF